ncbi:hypothetical protein HY933_04665 [Candidatus Falkowbacteria bacterium]|nr:hypothetical protein [Candidatus Falkowbacteria bacterium]
METGKVPYSEPGEVDAKKKKDQSGGSIYGWTIAGFALLALVVVLVIVVGIVAGIVGAISWLALGLLSVHISAIVLLVGWLYRQKAFSAAWAVIWAAILFFGIPIWLLKYSAWSPEAAKMISVYIETEADKQRELPNPPSETYEEPTFQDFVREAGDLGDGETTTFEEPAFPIDTSIHWKTQRGVWCVYFDPKTDPYPCRGNTGLPGHGDFRLKNDGPHFTIKAKGPVEGLIFSYTAKTGTHPVRKDDATIAAERRAYEEKAAAIKDKAAVQKKPPDEWYQNPITWIVVAVLALVIGLIISRVRAGGRVKAAQRAADQQAVLAQLAKGEVTVE